MIRVYKTTKNALIEGIILLIKKEIRRSIKKDTLTKKFFSLKCPQVDKQRGGDRTLLNQMTSHGVYLIDEKIKFRPACPFVMGTTMKKAGFSTTKNSLTQLVAKITRETGGLINAEFSRKESFGKSEEMIVFNIKLSDEVVNYIE
jgi:hypothetical protein